jgi:hypothetical protein
MAGDAYFFNYMSTSEKIGNDVRVQKLLEGVTRKGRHYLDANGKQVSLYREVSKLGYDTSTANLSVIISRMRGTYQRKPAKPRQKPLQLPEAVAVKNRARRRTSARIDPRRNRGRF